MPKLTDTQLVMLSNAAKRSDGSLLPLPKQLKLGKDARTNSIQVLIKKNLVAAHPATPDAVAWREVDGQRLMLNITPAGLRAIGAEPSDAESAGEQPRSAARRGPRAKTEDKKHGIPRKGGAAKASSSPGAWAGTKQARLIERLRQAQGASIADLVKVTGWQAHSVRGVMSGVLKKKLGLGIVSEKNANGERRYRLAE